MFDTALPIPAMKTELRYIVRCQLTLAHLECGRIVDTRHVQECISSPTAELSELLTDLYEQFRSPYLLGLEITSIHSPKNLAEHVWNS